MRRSTVRAVVLTIWSKSVTPISWTGIWLPTSRISSAITPKSTEAFRCAGTDTEYYSEVKDLLGGDYWADIDKFAERDFGSNAIAYQNNLDYYYRHGHAHAAKVGDKYGYDYYAHVSGRRHGRL